LGIKTYSLKGGYKAYRQKALEYFQSPLKLISLSGSTGSGKTEILQEFERQGEQVIDLEELANHKGSAFGGIGLGDQPTTEQFQNDLFEKILSFDRSKRIWIEDESIAVGKIFLPQPFWASMREAPVVKVEVDKAIRINRLVVDYGSADKADLIGAMEKITRKLGGQHFKYAKERLLENDLATTADILLTYYDKAYTKALETRKEKVYKTASFNWTDVSSFVKELRGSVNEIF
jgi:tRNA 2-selenouridine synthase